MPKTTDVHDTMTRTIECLAEALDWAKQAQGELPEPAPVDECSVLEQAANIAEKHGYYAHEADICALLIKVRAREMLIGMHATTAARKEGANA